MAFDARVFAEALMRAGQRFGQRFDWDWQRKKEMEYGLEEAKVKADYEQNLWKERQAQTVADQLRLEAEASRLRLEEHNTQKGFDAQFEAFLKSPDMVRNFALAEMSSNPLDKMRVMAQMKTIDKARMGQEFNQADWQVIDTLDPVSRGNMMLMVRENEDRVRQIRSNAANIDYMKALANSVNAKSEMTLEDKLRMITKLQEDNKGITSRMTEVMSKDTYMFGQKIHREAIAALGEQATDPNAIAVYMQEKLGPQWLTYMQMENELLQLRGAIESNEATMQMLYPEQPTALPIPSPAVTTTKQEPKTATKPGWLMFTEEGVGKVTEKINKSAIAKEEDKIKKRAGLPKTVKLTIFKDEEDLMSKRQSLKEGDYVYIQGDNEVTQLAKRDKAIGFGKSIQLTSEDTTYIK